MSIFLVKSVLRIVRAKNYETASTFVKVIQRKLLASFFPDTVYFGQIGINDITFYFVSPKSNYVLYSLDLCFYVLFFLYNLL